MGSDFIQDHYPADYTHCYGCGTQNPAGLHIESRWEGDEVVAKFTPSPHHIALPGYVYGGLIAALIDCHAIATAAAFRAREDGSGEVPRYVTANLNVQYLKPTPLGPELVLRAKARQPLGRKIEVDVELWAGDVVTARGLVLAAPMPTSMRNAASP